MGKKYIIKVNGKVYEVEIEEMIASDTQQNVQLSQRTLVQPTQDQTVDTAPVSQQVNSALTPSATEKELTEKVQTPSTQMTSSETEEVVAPMSGTVLKVNVKPGDTVKDAQTLVVIEAMKMENEILAPRDCKVKEIFVKDGQQVEIDQPLLTIE